MNLQTIIDLIDTQPESKEYTIKFMLPSGSETTLISDDRQRLKDMATTLCNHHKRDVRLSHEVDDFSHVRRGGGDGGAMRWLELKVETFKIQINDE